MNRIPFMTYKKNTFKIISYSLVFILSSCSSSSTEILGTSKFSSMQKDPNPYLFHVVEHGDSLWSISNYHYSDPLLWPDIFKNNKEKIYDADLILPGQSLIIYQNIPSRSKSKARAYAKSRGLWVVGYREESDITFLESD